jgi:7-cyano-7-deazaguanine synthase
MKDVHQANTGSSFAVLTSGGLDSAILLAESLKNHASVWPLYIRTELAWEDSELRHLRQFLEKIACPALQPLQVLELVVSDLYGKHWSLTGQDVPDAQSADDAVFLPGRNLLLLAKSMLWCHLHDVPELSLAVLSGNPFPDATASFFTAFQDVVNRSVGGQVKVLRPYDKLSKREVVALGQGLPLELTFSCIHPVRGKHCGACNKCAERRRGFAAAGIPDRTEYSAEASCTA